MHLTVVSTDGLDPQRSARESTTAHITFLESSNRLVGPTRLAFRGQNFRLHRQRDLQTLPLLVI